MDSQPKTLICFAAIQAVYNLSKTKSMKWAHEQLPLKIIEQMACTMNGLDLVEFITMNEGIMKIKSKFNGKAFQPFILNCFKNLDNRDLDETTRKLIKQQINDFEADYQEYDIGEDDTEKIDWITLSLGFGFNAIVQSYPYDFNEYEFFYSKFKQGQNYKMSRYPIPRIPSALSHVIPDDESISPFHSTLLPDMPKHYARYKMPEAVQELFFFKLTGMFQSYTNNRHHETLAYAAELLYNDVFLGNDYTYRYYLHVWGALAVTCARLHLSPTAVNSCINQMNKFIDYTSEKLDYLYYKQQVHMALGEIKEEMTICKEMMSLVPVASEFHDDTLKTHIQSTLRFVEDIILQVLCWDRFIEKEDVVFPWTEKAELVKIGKKTIKNALRLLHKELSQRPYSDYVDIAIEIFNLYKIGLDQTAYKTFIKIKKINYNYLLNDHHLFYFTSYYTMDNDYQLNKYQTDMNNYTSRIDQKARILNCEEVGDVAFVHFIMFAILERVNLETDRYFNQALTIYESFNNKRAIDLRNYKHWKRPNATTDMIVSDTCIDFNMEALIRMDPEVKDLIRSGINSVTRHDLDYYN
jgi:hypothetical protein